jgi:hypothetical protein
MDPRRPRFCEAGHTVALKLHGQATRRLRPASLVEPAQGYGRRRPHRRICAIVCLLFAHSRSSADRIRLLASSPKVRSQPCLASSACISFQLSNLPVFARETARRYISSLRLPIPCPPFQSVARIAAVGETMPMSHAAARRKNPGDAQNVRGNSTATLSASLTARTRALADHRVREVAAAGQKNPGLRSRP